MCLGFYRSMSIIGMRRVIVVATCLVSLFMSNMIGAEPFRVEDIRLQGLQRVSAGTVFNLLPVDVGEVVDGVSIRQFIRVLFASGYFDDVGMSRDENVLIVNVKERPAIESIELDGNKAVKSEDLLKGLADYGLREGEIFRQVTLERIGLELHRQYVAQGRYSAVIDTQIEELPRNRVAIKINIEEGDNAGIRHINVVGNTVFSQADLLDSLELKHPSLFSFFKDDHKYSREKLKGDIEKLESYYQDRGFVEMVVNSAQVSITPDKRDVYVTVNVDEGEKYIVKEVTLIGDLQDVDPENVRALFLVSPGETFSRARVVATEETITAVFGNSGYTFASASGITEVSEDGTVDLKFYVDAGKRTYVRRLSFAGNSVTQDHVLRREMRQMEGGWASRALIDLSKVRLERLGFFQEVNVETPEVPGTDDQIDVEFEVEEQPTGSISATLGYAQSFGLMLGANYQQQNALGTGNSVTFGLGWSDFSKSVSFNFFDPYFTVDGISRGFNAFFRRSNFAEQNIAGYSSDAKGLGVNFGFPIGETQRIQVGLNVEHTDISEGLYTSLEISDFLFREGNEFLNYKLQGGWQYSTLNRGLFPTAGRSQTLKFVIAGPGSDVSSYKVSYDGEMYFPFRQDWSLRLWTELGFGGVYGDTETFPFYENFYAGGFGSVRGFQASTLGPRATLAPSDTYYGRFDSVGGNLLVQAGTEIIFPLPFVEDQYQVRPVIFFDVGNVFNTDCPTAERLSLARDLNPADLVVRCSRWDANALRYSAGVSLTWLTGMGPITFALAVPFNYGPYDEKEKFSFQFGRTF